MDGCFDLMHFGHSNVFRQAKKLGNRLVVGVNSNAEIEKHKGGVCVMGDAERNFMVRSCRWVDEIIEGAPYVPNMKFVLEQNCQLIVHGDDLAISETGQDCYAEAKSLNMYREVSRTKYVSTTEMVGRMLLQRNASIVEDTLSSKCMHMPEYAYSKEKQKYIDSLLNEFELPGGETTEMVVYVDGTFDLFHPGHASLLKKCKESNYFVIVGVFSSETTYKLKNNYPIQAMKERILTVSACKYVDKILKDVPLRPNIKFLKDNNIHKIITGLNDPHLENYDLVRTYVPIEQIESDFPTITTSTIVEKVIKNYHTFTERNKKRKMRGC